jgi:hypothetical protein
MKSISLAITFILLSGLSLSSQTLNDVLNKTKEAAGTNTAVTKVIETTETLLNSGKANTPSLTNEEVIKGLKEALTIGTKNSSEKASKLDGFLKNSKIFIPWPEEAKDMRSKLMKLGMEKKIIEFETSLNRAAEEAAKKASPVFIDAITSMSLKDGFEILNGSDSAATNYLRKTTYQPLYNNFMPIVKEAIEKVKVTSYWNPLVTKYNKIPGVKKQNPDLDKYVCNKAVNGLMLLIMEEEQKIRKDPLARVTDLLAKVFGYKK